ncbi:unnamed protein product, partial [Symbiodinium sp. KB8]
AGLHFVGLGSYLLLFPATSKYCYFRNFDGSFQPTQEDVYEKPLIVRTSDGLKVTLELEFVFRLQMNNLRSLYMLVGAESYQNTLVHIASGTIAAHATNFSAQAFYGDRGGVASAFQEALTQELAQRLYINVMSFQLQPAHFPKEYAAAIVETQEMKQDIQVAEQENKTKVIRKQTELFSARQLAHQIVIKAEGDAQQTLVSNQADVAQFKYRQQVLAEGYARALQFFSASGQDAVPEFLSYMKLEAFKAHDNSKKTVKLTPANDCLLNLMDVPTVLHYESKVQLKELYRELESRHVLVGTFVPKLRTWLEAIVKAANFMDQDAMSVDLQDLLRARHHAILTRRSTQHVGVMLCKLEQDSRKLASLGVVFNFEELQIHDDDQNELESFQDVFQQFIGLHPGLPLEPLPAEEEEDPAVTMNLLEGLSDQAPTEIRRHKLLRWQAALRRLASTGPLVPEQPSLEVLELATTLLLPQLLHSKALSFSAGSDSARSCPAFDMSEQAFGHMAPMPNVALGELEVLLCDILAELCDLYPKHICPLLWRLFREYLKDPGHWHSCLLVLALLTRLSCFPWPLPYRRG